MATKQKEVKDVWERFEKKRNKVDILFQAIGYMQQYNGRTVKECVELAMDN